MIKKFQLKSCTKNKVREQDKYYNKFQGQK